MAKKKAAPALSTFDDLDAAGIGAGYRQPSTAPSAPEDAPVEERGLLRTVGDYGISALKGAIAVPEAVVGLADIPTGGRVGRALESAGFRPREAKAMLDQGYSMQQQDAFRAVQDAEGFGGKLAAAVQNPSVIAHTVAESLPAVGAGGVVGRGLIAAAPRIGAVGAAAAGEGIVGAGGAAEQIRQQTHDGLMTAQQSGLALASGGATAAFGALGGKIARSLGIGDVDTMLVGATANSATAKGVVRRVLEGAASEGLLEELPQSVSEQVIQNVALGRDLSDGVDQAAVLGMLSGAAMGGGVNVPGGASAPTAPEVPSADVAPETPAAHAQPAGPLARAAGAIPPQPAVEVSVDPAQGEQPAPFTPEEVRAFNNAYRREVPDPLGELRGQVQAGTNYTTPNDVQAVGSRIEDSWLRENVTEAPAPTAESPAAPDATAAAPAAPLETEPAGDPVGHVDGKLRESRILQGLQNIFDAGPVNAMATVRQLNQSLSRIGEAPLSQDERVRVKRAIDAQAGFTGQAEPAPLPSLPPAAVDTNAQNAALEALIPERQPKAAPAQAEPAGPQVFPTYEEADSYRREQRRRGASITALPVETQGGFTLAASGTPEYAQGVALRDERRAAKERADAGILDGDIMNRLSKPFTVRLPALNAAKKAGPGHQVVQVTGGFVVRKGAADGTADAVQPGPDAGHRVGGADAAGGVEPAPGRNGATGPAATAGSPPAAAPAQPGDVGRAGTADAVTGEGVGFADPISQAEPSFSRGKTSAVANSKDVAAGTDMDEWFYTPRTSNESPASSSDDASKFSRAPATPAAAADRMATVQRTADEITAAWASAPRVVVVRNIDDLKVPAAVRGERDQRASLAMGEIRGAWHDGIIYLMADNLPTEAHAAITLYHEALGHAGLRGAFGDALTPILRDIARLRRADITEKAREYGLDLSNAEDRLTAAEEVLAEWAQRRPGIGFVRRAVAAIRQWLRQNVPGLSRMRMTDDEIVGNFLLPARGWIERGPDASAAATAPAFSRGTNPAPPNSNGAPMFSRAAAGALNDPRQFRDKAGQALTDLFDAPGAVNWWHKTVGTMHNMARRSPKFGRVFDAVQGFLQDVSHYATEAADLAPSILPKLETWRDIGKSPLSAEDTKAIAAPIFEGTLSWTRDAAGTLVRSSDDAAPAGVVFTDEELREKFKATPKQIALYREFRAATDQSLNRMTISEMLRFGGKDVAAVRDMALTAGTAQEAAAILRQHLDALAEEQPARKTVLDDTAARIEEKAARAQELVDGGYAPLSRFGHYTLDVLDENGERAYFGMFESRGEANRMARRMRENFPKGTVTQGTVSEQAYKMFAGITPETLELFGDMVGLEADGDEAQHQMFQQYLKLAKANRSAMKRLIRRKGIAGFNEDAGRVLAGFIYSNARLTSTNLHTGEISQATAAIPKTDGELKDMAIKLADYVRNPQEEAQALRGLMFVQYLGGSLASAMVNMTQPVAVTMPYLSQWGGAVKAAGRMRSALADVMKKSTGDKELDEALKRAEADGIVAPQEVHQLMAQASGRGSLRAGDGTTMGNARAKASNALSKVALAWGKPFAAAEQFNRRVTFIAAYRTAVAEGQGDPSRFAEEAIRETQFVYNKGNKPQWARGAIGSTLFTFKQYSISYVELLQRMYQSGPEGKRAAAFAVAMLFLMSGAGGLPFMGDAEDILDGIMQRLGYSFSTKQARKQFLIDTLGEGAAEFVDRGVSGLPGVPIDVAGRLGMDNLIPGTGLLTKKADYGREVAEILGPAGDFAKRVFQGAGQITGGDVVRGVATMSPKAIANAGQAMDMYQTGMYRDQRGRKVVDSDGYDALIKGIGFQPSAVAAVQDATGTQQQMIAQNRMMKSELADAMAQAMFEKDAEAQAAVRKRVQTWNLRNPSSPISIDMSGVRRRLAAMRSSKAERVEKAAPAGIRNEVRRALAESPA